MKKIDEIKAEFEGVEIEWRLHERIRQMFAYIEAAEAFRKANSVESMNRLGIALDEARRALGLE